MPPGGGPPPALSGRPPARSPQNGEPPTPDSAIPEADEQEPQDREERTPPSSVQAALDAWRDSDVLALPLPPAPPGERGYRPGDVERLVKLLARAIADTEDGPRPDDLTGVKLSRTFFIGQGYHIGAVEALRAAWVSELRRREL